MNSIRQIRLTKTDFIIDIEGTPLKFKYENNSDKYIVDISKMNLIKATKIAIMCSTYCFINDFKKKICWIVGDEEIKRAISVLRLRNIEQILPYQKESLVMAS